MIVNSDNQKQIRVLLASIGIGIVIVSVVLIRQQRVSNIFAPSNNQQSQESHSIFKLGLENATLTIGECTVSVVIASTSEEKARGLSGQTSLPSNTGMVFPCEKSPICALWMKDMFIPLDMIWWNEGRVVHIEENVQPASHEIRDADIKVYSPVGPFDYVVEVAAGMAEGCSIKIDTPVYFAREN